MYLKSYDFGFCTLCNVPLLPDVFLEEEYKGQTGAPYKTGRKRWAVNCLYCPVCNKKYTVDDSFDGPWFT